MWRYCVLEPPEEGQGHVERAVVIKDGFSLVAMVAPMFWFLWHRMWLEAAIVFIISAMLGAMSMVPGLEVAPAAGLFMSVLVGMEARNLLAQSYRRSGWREWGVIVAPNRDEAEIRYAAEALHDEAEHKMPASASTEGSTTKFAPNAKTPAFGLIDYPRRG